MSDVELEKVYLCTVYSISVVYKLFWANWYFISYVTDHMQHMICFIAHIVWVVSYESYNLSQISIPNGLIRCSMKFCIALPFPFNGLLQVLKQVLRQVLEHFSCDIWNESLLTSMLVTDVWDQICWWRIWDVGDRNTMTKSTR